MHVGFMYAHVCLWSFEHVCVCLHARVCLGVGWGEEVEGEGGLHGIGVCLGVGWGEEVEGEGGLHGIGAHVCVWSFEHTCVCVCTHLCVYLVWAVVRTS